MSGSRVHKTLLQPASYAPLKNISIRNNDTNKSVAVWQPGACLDASIVKFKIITYGYNLTIRFRKNQMYQYFSTDVHSECRCARCCQGCNFFVCNSQIIVT